ncbi:phage major capsid protein [Flexivirga sp.]|uniref:phage major capsid protein n=1 Tax=Flexivirga sp. TaxID=1962927 RepID=UPI003F7D7D97
MTDALLTRFDDQIADAKEKMGEILDRAQNDGNRALKNSEVREYDRQESLVDSLEANRAVMAGTIAKEDAARARHDAHVARVEVHSRELGVTGDVERSRNEYARMGGVYLPENGYSFFKDMCRARSGDYESAQRLAEDASRTRALSTTNSAAGEFVPPLWLVDQFVQLARPGRVTADVLRREALPAGTDSINVPKIATGSNVAQQAAQNTAISQVDMTTSSVTAPVITLAGAQVVSSQLVEQSPIDVDRMVIGDLAADYARALNLAILTGSGSGGQIEGLQSVATAVPYTATTPSSEGVIQTVAQALATVAQNRYAPATHILMTPTRWASLLAATDSTGRPMVVADGIGLNAFGGQSIAGAQGRVGTLLGLPVFVDPSIPSDLGAGTNQDEIFVLRAEDSILYESDIHVGAFEQTYASQLSWLVRVHAYVALAHRQPKSVAVVSGTGMTTPVFGK